MGRTSPSLLACAFPLLTAAACGGNPASGGAGGTGGTGGGGAGGGGGTGGFGPPPAGFACVGSVVLPTTADTTRDVVLRFHDNFTKDPVPGVTAKLCPGPEPLCTQPLATGSSDANGDVPVTLPLGPNGYEGFLEASAPGYLTTLVQGANPFLPVPAQIFDTFVYQDNLASLAQQVYGVTLDPTKGQLVVYANNCSNLVAAGVQVAVDPAADLVGYTKAGAPDLGATATEATGVAYAFNLPAGEVTVTGLLSTGQPFGAATVHIRSGALTQLFLAPTP